MNTFRYGYFTRVPEAQLAELDELREEYADCSLSSPLNRQLIFESNHHSDLIEHSQLNRRGMKKKQKEETQKQSETLSHLNQSWEWAKDEYRNNGRNVTMELLDGIVTRLEPDTPFHGYREMMGFAKNLDRVYPQPAKIGELMFKLYERLNADDNGMELHPVDRAIMAHLHIGRIHPYEDGNGRTARLVQNLILFDEGYAPATLQIGDRRHYIDSIGSAQDAYIKGVAEDIIKEVEIPIHGQGQEISFNERQFYTLMASKIATTFEQGFTIIDRLPKYSIKVGKIDKPALLHLQRVIHGKMRKVDPICQAHIEDHDTGTIKVIGNIHLGQLEHIVSQKARNLGYNPEKVSIEQQRNNHC